MPAGTTQFDGGPDVYDPGPGGWVDTTPTIKVPQPGPDPTGPPATHHGPPPWHAGVTPFPQFDWSVGQDIPDPVLNWFRSTVGPLVSWYTQNRGQNIGPLQNWAGNPMDALRGANLPAPLMQALFNRGISEMQGRGIGGPGAWSPEGDAYKLWSQFLGMDHPQQVGVPPNEQVPPSAQQVSLTKGQAPGAGGVPGGQVGIEPWLRNPDITAPRYSGPPGMIRPGDFDWLRNLRP